MAAIAIFLVLLAGCAGSGSVGGANYTNYTNKTNESGRQPGEPISTGATYRNITVDQLMAALPQKNFFLLDVHIPEQQHLESTDAFVPYNAIEANLAKLPSSREEAIVVYCRTGRMSGEAAQRVVDLGYKNVFNVLGGKEAFDALKAKMPEFERLKEEVAPSAGVVLPVRWGHAIPKLVENGVLDFEKFEMIMERNGRPLTDEQRKILSEGSDGNIMMTREDSLFVLNVLWALGLANKNPILTDGPMGEYEQKGNFASTGGWTLGAKPGGELLGTLELIKLTPEQQKVMEGVAMSTYRPCCNNPTGFPDCNHGMAALALAELMASQGASENEIYKALLTANSYWFSQNYLDLAVYFKEVEGKEWKDVDPAVALSADFSSYSGYARARQQIQSVPFYSGGSCGL